MNCQRQWLWMAACLSVLSVSALAAGAQEVRFANYKGHEWKTANETQERSLKTVLLELEKKYGVSFVYLEQVVESKTVSGFIISKRSRLEEDLRKLLSGTHLTYRKVTEKQFAILENDFSSLPLLQEAEGIKPVSRQTAVAAGKDPIRGRIVSNRDKTPLDGATITVKGTNRATVTNNVGEFVIDGKMGDVLVVNYVGYEPQEITVNSLTDLSVALTERPGNMGEVVVVGSRSSVARTNVERPVPVDVFSARDIQKTGQVELGQMIHFSAPSFNSTKHGISNVTSYVDPATLRGLGPDQTLVLVNNKRRHQSAALNVNNVVGRGTVGTDLNIIPTAAIERVEILRDGAAAQYGSDAIAGIVNLQLKRASHGGSVMGHYGKTKKGDGATYEQGINFGLPLGKKGGFINTTLQFHHNNPTDRSGAFNGRVYNSNVAKDDSIIAARNFNRQIPGTKYGTSKNTSGISFINAELPLTNNWAVYSFGGYSYKSVTAYGFFRPPSNPRRAVLNIYPNGYSPVFPATLKDVSGTVGFKGITRQGWKMDFSNTYGRNQIELFVNNTVNPSYGEASPTSFYGGTLEFGQNSTNIDFAKTFSNVGSLKSLTVAMGSELRLEHYQIKQGDDPSWRKGPLVNTDVGASGREGFSDVNAVNRNRRNMGVYADVESDITSKLLLSGALRFENYSDFGSNVSGKLSGRYKIVEALSVRGSINRGFRAPSMHQLFYSNNSDAQWLTINNKFDAYPIGHLRNDNQYVQALGVGKLKAETSLDYNLGMTLQLAKKFLLTADLYQIDIKDRVVISSQLDATSPELAPIFNNSGFALVQFFSNALDTRTKGVDVVASYKERWNKSELNLSAGLMLNETKLHGDIRTPAKLASLGSKLIDRVMLGLIEVAQPRNKAVVSASYRYRKVEGLVRSTRFGEVIARQSNPAQDQTFSAKIITDASLTYNVSQRISFSLGANNIGDVYPDKIALVPLTGSGQTPYTRFTSQFGFMGAYYYGSVRVSF